MRTSDALRLRLNPEQRLRLRQEGRRYRMSEHDLVYAIVARTIEGDIVGAVIDEDAEGGPG